MRNIIRRRKSWTAHNLQFRGPQSIVRPPLATLPVPHSRGPALPHRTVSTEIDHCVARSPLPLPPPWSVHPPCGSARRPQRYIEPYLAPELGLRTHKRCMLEAAHKYQLPSESPDTTRTPKPPAEPPVPNPSPAHPLHKPTIHATHATHSFQKRIGEAGRDDEAARGDAGWSGNVSPARTLPTTS